MYDRYGYYKDAVYSITLEGKVGIEKIASIIEELEKKTPEKIGAYKVLAMRNYRKDIRKDMVSGEEGKTGLPNSNVLYYELDEGAWVCVRPSGTEPKLKLYYGIKSGSFEAAEKDGNALSEALKAMIDAMM